MSTVTNPAAGSAVTNPSAVPPGTVAKKPRNTKNLAPYPGSVDSVGNAVKLSVVPADYDRNKHARIGKKDFSDPALYYDFRASEARKMVSHWETEASDERSGENKDKKKLLTAAKKMKELRERLASEGVDVEALLATLG